MIKNGMTNYIVNGMLINTRVIMMINLVSMNIGSLLIRIVMRKNLILTIALVTMKNGG
jgi:hypothetical protein